MEPEASAEILLRALLNVDKANFFSVQNTDVKKSVEKKYLKYLERRKKHEPVWQILGQVDFWGMNFRVNKNVLIPRPETELLIAEVLRAVNSPKTILEVGTGSGAIAVALAKEFSWARVEAVDISRQALRMASFNIKRLGFSKQIRLYCSNLFSRVRGKFEIIVANLPYIPEEDLQSLALDVHHFEPRVALDGGRGGLEVYERFLAEAVNHLAPNAMVFCEIGINQGEDFKKIVKKYFPKASVVIKKDLAAIDRIATIKL